MALVEAAAQHKLAPVKQRRLVVDPHDGIPKLVLNDDALASYSPTGALDHSLLGQGANAVVVEACRKGGDKELVVRSRTHVLAWQADYQPAL